MVSGRPSDLVLPIDLSPAKETAIGMAGAAAATVLTGAAAMLFPATANASNLFRGARLAHGQISSAKDRRDEVMATNERNQLTRQQLGLKYLQRAQARGGNLSNLLCREARGLWAMNHKNPALSVALRAVEADRKNVDALLIAAFIYSKMSQLTDELAMLELAFELAPNRYEIACSLAKAYLGVEARDEANTIWERASVIDSKQTEPWLNQAEYHRSRSNYSEAKRCYEAAKRSGAAITLPWIDALAKANSAISANQISEAMTFLELAALYDPQWARPIVGMGICAARRDDKQAAVAFFERALTLDPENSQAALLAGNLRSEFGDQDTAERLWRRAFALDQSSEVPWVIELQKGKAALRTRNAESAISHITEAQRRNNPWDEAAEMLSEARKILKADQLRGEAEREAKNGQMLVAETLWRSSFDTDDSQSGVSLIIGALCADRAETTEALEFFGKAAQLGHPLAATAIALCRSYHEFDPATGPK